MLRTVGGVEMNGLGPRRVWDGGEDVVSELVCPPSEIPSRRPWPWETEGGRFLIYTKVPHESCGE